MTKTYAATLRTVAFQPHCIDAAVASLEQLASRKPAAGVLSDLAATYYVRAQQKNQPADFVRGMSTAQRAVTADPSMPGARFNLALLQESLGFGVEALRSWTELARIDRSPWGLEAATHRKAVAARLTTAAATQWPLVRDQLQIAWSIRDVRAIAAFVAPYPAPVQRYVEEELLPRWAREEPADRERTLEFAEAIAKPWTDVTGDGYLEDVLRAIRAATGDETRRTQLSEAHLAFGAARNEQRALRPLAALTLYRKAEEDFARAASPMQSEAAIGAAVALSYSQGAAAAMPLLDRVAAEATRRQSDTLLASIHYTRGFLLLYGSRYVDSLAEYDRAIALYERLHDEEGLANAHARKSGVFRTLGQREPAWAEATLAKRYENHVAGVAARHAVIGETAASAMDLGYPDVAVLEQDTAVRLIKDELARAPEADHVAISGLRKNLAIALRGRAEFELHLDRYEEAHADLDDAIRLAEGTERSRDEAMRRTLLVRIDEIDGRSWLETDPQRAAEAFTRALAAAIPDDYRTFRAMVLAERAHAYACLRQMRLARRDLEAAIAEIRTEEAVIMRNRTSGGGETLWSRYFARFQETYHELIRQLVANHEEAKAFAYAERARAFEPLNLVLQLKEVPPRFRELAGEDDLLQLPQIQAELPPGTFLIAYTVLEDQTIAWVLSRTSFHVVPLPLSARAIQEWAQSLRAASANKDGAAFEAALRQLPALIAQPLAAVRAAAAKTAEKPRLVFIPDGAIHNLPMAALLDPATGRHVVEEAPVAIAGSAALYLFSLMHDRDLPPDAKPRVLLVGDPAFDRRLPEAQGFERLDNAESEVERIRQLYTPVADVRTGADATVPDFLERARRSAVVHLAGHAIANPDVPSHSLLLLAPAPAQQQNGILDAKDLLTNLHVQRTRLFVLSACSSAGGVAIGPEGLAPLVRPLIAAGVPGVIGTLSSIQDDSSEELMVRFHHYYREGEDAAAALRDAQIESIHDHRAAVNSSLAWAPFQVVGFASSPFPSDLKSERRHLQ